MIYKQIVLYLQKKIEIAALNLMKNSKDHIDPKVSSQSTTVTIDISTEIAAFFTSNDIDIVDNITLCYNR